MQGLDGETVFCVGFGWKRFFFRATSKRVLAEGEQRGRTMPQWSSGADPQLEMHRQRLYFLRNAALAALFDEPGRIGEFGNTSPTLPDKKPGGSETAER